VLAEHKEKYNISLRDKVNVSSSSGEGHGEWRKYCEVVRIEDNTQRQVFLLSLWPTLQGQSESQSGAIYDIFCKYLHLISLIFDSLTVPDT
jgi:hypothetical protein